jgi:hypothetical protein
MACLGSTFKLCHAFQSDCRDDFPAFVSAQESILSAPHEGSGMKNPAYEQIQARKVKEGVAGLRDQPRRPQPE